MSDGFHLWSETYDRELRDIFAVQEDIARAVAGLLQVALLWGEKAASPAKGTNVEAYNAVLQGRYFYDRRGKENLERAVGYFEQAIKLDPQPRSRVGWPCKCPPIADGWWRPPDSGGQQ